MPAQQTKPIIPGAELPILTAAQHTAIQQVANGTATEHQQKIFWDTLISDICEYGSVCIGVDDMETRIRVGRRSPAVMLMTYLARPVNLEEQTNDRTEFYTARQPKPRKPTTGPDNPFGA